MPLPPNEAAVSPLRFGEAGLPAGSLTLSGELQREDTLLIMNGVYELWIECNYARYTKISSLINNIFYSPLM